MNPPKFETNVVKIGDTMKQKYVLSHVADKNLQNTTFGGTMMRECFELSFITAYLFGIGGYPNLVHISDTQFHAPVPYGSMIRFQSQIIYTFQNLLSVYVSASTIQKEDKNWTKMNKTNDFYVTFQLPQNQNIVVPETYKEAMMYVEGERRVKGLIG